MAMLSTGVLCAALALIISGCSQTAPAPASAAKKNDKAKAAQVSTNDVVVIETQAEFESDLKSKDPFFPKSRRRFANIASGKTVAQVPTMAELKLRGVIGSPGKYIAMINDKTFAEGDKSQVAVGSNQHLVVKVNKINPKSVNVSVDGEAAPRDLLLDVAHEAKK